MTRTPLLRSILFWVELPYFSESLPLGSFFDLLPVHFRQLQMKLVPLGLPGLSWPHLEA